MSNSTFEYNIKADDYLTHQLFIASINPQAKKQRRKGMFIWVLAFFAMAVVFYFQNKIHLTLYFTLFGIGFIFIYPLYTRWFLKRYYKKYITKNFKDSSHNQMTLTISDKSILISNQKNEGEILISDFEKVYEINYHIFIKLIEGRNIIIPKETIVNKQELVDKLTDITSDNNIGYIKILDWKWR